MQEYIDRIQQGDNGAMAGLWQQVNRYTYKIVNNFARLSDPDDLTQEAFLAVVGAAQHYDKSTGIPFLQYMGKCVSLRLTTYITQSDAYVPINLRHRRNKIARFKEDYYKVTGKEPSDYKIRKELGLSVSELRDAYLAAYAQTAKSISEEIGEGITIGDTIPDPENKMEDSMRDADREKMAAALWDIVDSIDGGRILRMIYKEGMTLQEVAECENVSNTAISDRKKRLLKKIRRAPNLEPLRSYHEEYIAGLYQRGGLSSFKRTGTSEPEWIALRNLSKQAEAYRFIYETK